ncbi:MAG TPA: O-antigen ligase family protein [Streptosporangiaceae bacterium]|nr:O-antigen ligase family protein [Streptosporangiaceae bacterium]
MTAERGLPGLGLADRRSRAVGAVMLVAAVAAAAVVGRWSLPVLAGLGVLAVLGFLLSRLPLVVAALAAGFYFNAYLSHGAGLITIDKGIGALAVVAWGLEWAVSRRPIIVTRQMWLLGAFLLWTFVSLTVAVNEKAALVTTLRYVIFATLFFLVVQTVHGDRRRAGVLVHIVVAAAAVAAVIGLVAFLRHQVVQASGPLKDPNDFGFLLASTLPLAVYETRWAATRWARVLADLAMAVIGVCTLATFSRSALTGLAVAVVWALVTGRLRLRWLVVGLACAVVVVSLALVLTPQQVTSALTQRAHVASANVSERLGYYRVELNEWDHYPVTGVGPGNFVYRFYQFAPAVGESLPYPSNVLTISGEDAYLVILAEQGVVGLTLFLGYLALSWAGLRRRFPGDERSDQLQTALAAGFVVACVGALFLAEQYYPPLWFLPALGAALAGDPRQPMAGRPMAAGRMAGQP